MPQYHCNLCKLSAFFFGELEDLRSRALLLLGKEKTPRPHNVEGTRKKSIDFDGFILMVDLMLDIS